MCILKLLVARRRPQPVTDTVLLVLFDVDSYSFPSGHCSRAVLVSLLLPTLMGACVHPSPNLGHLYCMDFAVPGELPLRLRGLPPEWVPSGWTPLFQLFVQPIVQLFTPLRWLSSTYLPCVLFVWTVAICMSRLYLLRHHMSDVLAGCLLGLFEYVSVMLACTFIQ